MKRLPVRVIVIGLIVLLHGIVFYVVIHQRARPGNGDDRQAFTPVVRETGGPSGSLGEKPRPAAATSVPAESHWRFDAIEVLPSEGPDETPATDVTEKLVDSPDASPMTIKSWTRPDYPLAWARAGEEGSVSLDAHLDASGKPTEVKLLNAAAPAHLVQSAQNAVAAWRFSTPAAVTTWAQIELRFSPYRYGYSFVGESMPEGTPNPGKKPVSSAEAFRHLLSGLSSSKPTLATYENSQPMYQKMRTTVIKWGRPTQVRLLNPKEKDWKEYAVKREYRGSTYGYGGTITLRWDQYEVQHEHVKARWKVAVDPYERIFAVKADTW